MAESLRRLVDQFVRTKEEDIELEGFQAQPVIGDNDVPDFYQWRCVVPGLPGTPWEGAEVVVFLLFTHAYPREPPCVLFEPTIFHPNVLTTGVLNVSLLDAATGWHEDMSVSALLRAIQGLLSTPELDDPVREEAFLLYRDNRDDYHHMLRRQALRCMSKKKGQMMLTKSPKVNLPYPDILTPSSSVAASRTPSPTVSMDSALGDECSRSFSPVGAMAVPPSSPVQSTSKATGLRDHSTPDDKLLVLLADISERFNNDCPIENILATKYACSENSTNSVECVNKSSTPKLSFAENLNDSKESDNSELTPESKPREGVSAIKQRGHRRRSIGPWPKEVKAHSGTPLKKRYIGLAPKKLFSETPTNDNNSRVHESRAAIRSPSPKMPSPMELESTSANSFNEYEEPGTSGQPGNDPNSVKHTPVTRRAEIAGPRYEGKVPNVFPKDTPKQILGESLKPTVDCTSGSEGAVVVQENNQEESYGEENEFSSCREVGLQAWEDFAQRVAASTSGVSPDSDDPADEPDIPDTNHMHILSIEEGYAMNITSLADANQLITSEEIEYTSLVIIPVPTTEEEVEEETSPHPSKEQKMASICEFSASDEE